jgi:hypothetical protein
VHALLIAESTPKLMRLASFARATVPELHWRTATTGAFTRTVDRFDTKTLRTTFKTKHKIHVNRLVALATDVDTVYVATDPTARGELLASDLADHILDRYPDRQIRRLTIDRMTTEAFRSAYDNYDIINRRKADSMRVSRVINFLVSTRIEAMTGKASGRAVLPLLNRVRELEWPEHARIRLRLGSGVTFYTNFYPEPLIRSVFERVRTEVPGFTVQGAAGQLDPPALYDVWRLQQDGCRVLGARAIEVASQLEQLYHGGYVARDHRVSDEYVAAAHAELEAFGDAASERLPVELAGTVPTNLRCLPSDVPKPVRPVYRLVWANTLCAFGRPMQVQRETASFTVDGVRFRAESLVPLSPGFDHVGFGLFYRRGHIGQSRAVEEARMFGPGPFEHELLGHLRLRLQNPALALKAAENIGYLGFDGPEVTVLEWGRSVLDVVGKSVPQLLDGRFFDSVERYLESEHDPHELLEPWGWWAETVSKAVKRRGVAYLR